MGEDDGMMRDVDELVLRTVVFEFDGRVVEVFGHPGVIRYHVAQLKEPQIVTGPNRKGRTTIKLGSNSFGIDADEMALVTPFLDRIRAAVRAARAAHPVDDPDWTHGTSSAGPG
jgi:hypothetical protein